MIDLPTFKFSILDIWAKGSSSNYSLGPDSLPEILLNPNHVSTYALSYPIHIIFNWSIRSGHFPSFLKLSFVIPIFKAGSRETVTNYRPISKLSSFPKLFKKLLRPPISRSF